MIGGIAMLFGGYTLYGAIHGPFQAAQKAAAKVTAADLQRIAQLKTVDTDRDGLSDYDELYVYHTSPYLVDSDSDGIPDGAEVRAGTDPNCPEGKQCVVTTANANATVGNVNAAAVNAALSGQLTAAELRQVLAGAGAPQYLLDATPDNQLLALYKSLILESANANGTAGNANAAGNTNTVGSADIGNLTPAEIRQLLIQNGVDATSLTQIDDATLLSIFRNSLQQVQTNANATP